MTKSLREVIKEAGLSRKQAAIFRLYIDGKPNSFICRAVSISERTIGSYLSEIVGRLGVSKKEDLPEIFGPLREQEDLSEDLDQLYDRIDTDAELFGRSQRERLMKKKAKALRKLWRGVHR